jgi:hypothetical protein
MRVVVAIMDSHKRQEEKRRLHIMDISIHEQF